MIDYDRLFSRAAASVQESAIRKMGALGLRVPDLISFAPGFPAPDVFVWDEFRDIAASVLDGADVSVLQYPPTRGYRPLVEALPQILSDRGITAGVDEMIITTGSQQALDLCARVFINPGDGVLVDLPTYTGAITFFVDGRHSEYARLSFSAASHERIDEGIRRLTAAVRGEVEGMSATGARTAH